jgi:hypothetical protein
MAETTTINGRCMYIWKLEPILKAEMGLNNLVRKATRAKLSSVWIKIAEGRERYRNLTGSMQSTFKLAVEKLHERNIKVWGWHVPHAPTSETATQEASLVANLAREFGLDGILMDAEAEASFFRGTAQTAEVYARNLRDALTSMGVGLAISSHDIPTNFPNFPFDVFARHSTLNVPQVYYGGSPSVTHRLNRALRANSHLSIPFVPVGAGWVGNGGGCSSASACAERSIIFMRLAREHRFPGYSFWHWGGAPSNLWEVLFTEPV